MRLRSRAVSSKTKHDCHESTSVQVDQFRGCFKTPRPVHRAKTGFEWSREFIGLWNDCLTILLNQPPTFIQPY